MGIAKKKNPLSQDNVRYKTRLVLKGYTQNEGVDYLRALAKNRRYMAWVLYANVTGSLVYTLVCTRPDISYAVRMVNTQS